MLIRPEVLPDEAGAEDPRCLLAAGAKPGSGCWREASASTGSREKKGLVLYNFHALGPYYCQYLLQQISTISTFLKSLPLLYILKIYFSLFWLSFLHNVHSCIHSHLHTIYPCFSVKFVLIHCAWISKFQNPYSLVSILQMSFLRRVFMWSF